MMAGDIRIVRDLTDINKGYANLKTSMKDTQQELNNVNRGLRLNSESTELLAKKNQLLSTQLEQQIQKSEMLGDAIAELNRIKAESGELDATQEKMLANYTRQQKDAEVQVIALTGAIDKQSKAKEQGALTSDEFSKSMTNLNATLNIVRRSATSVNQIFSMFGGDKDSTMGIILGTVPKAISVFTGLYGVIKMVGASGFFAAKGMGAFKSALTFGAAAVAITAGIYAINRSIKEVEENAKKEADKETGRSGSFGSMPSILTSSPSIPRSSAAGTGNVTVQTLSQRQIQDAVIAAIIQTGLNQQEFIASAEIDGREFARFIFNDLIRESAERGGGITKTLSGWSFI